MGNNLFGELGNLGGLGGLVKGFSGLMPQDDPDVKLMNAKSELSDLKKQEEQVYAQIGKRAVEMSGGDAFGELGDKLALIQSNLVSAEKALAKTQSEKEEHEKRQKEEEAAKARSANVCRECGHENGEGVKFCQECGAKLASPGAKTFCTSCGAELASGTRFCGECGAKQD